jgi:hypothetical protein
VLRPLRQFVRLDRARKRLFLEAWRQLAAVRVSLAVTPFRKLIAELDRHPGSFEPLPVGGEALADARCIGWAVAAAARYTPWRSTCLLQVLAAQRMLARRLLPGAFYIGAASGEAGVVGLAAHAWLKCGDTFITGESGHEQYAVVSSFSWS